MFNWRRLSLNFVAQHCLPKEIKESSLLYLFYSFPHFDLMSLKKEKKGRVAHSFQLQHASSFLKFMPLFLWGTDAGVKHSKLIYIQAHFFLWHPMLELNRNLKKKKKASKRNPRGRTSPKLGTSLMWTHLKFSVREWELKPRTHNVQLRSWYLHIMSCWHWQDWSVLLPHNHSTSKTHCSR